ncbi:hypothetical protein GO730_03125 [Spirosoma sp. HMF3257]|uniref:Acid-shock protein n=1 Tax=Spirosoma telluris TaxID=2183553 RepID=A0A327NI95_9BACT|nr:hypothetical protein [Spirosoma telluris]RAI73654.1 hypothetical protein HMF3257_03055 [Spirosoma telluris]
MKKSILATLAVAALCVNISFANTPSQDKPVSKTMTVKKTTTPATKSKTTTSAVHKKHVKQS